MSRKQHSDRADAVHDPATVGQQSEVVRVTRDDGGAPGAPTAGRRAERRHRFAPEPLRPGRR